MAALPTGTITFLFTDLEGSTRLWEDFPEAMSTALARHDAILRESIGAYGGVVFKTIGDAFCAAFSAADRALAAALHGQQRVQSELWPQIGELRVRIAIHSGWAETRDNDYFGQTLNRVARLLSSAHGGQTLLSDTAQTLVRGRLPNGCTLRDLGQHRLRGLQEAERIFQLVHPDLRADFPALRTSGAKPNNLTASPTPLIGRTQEVATLLNLLCRDDPRLVTLTGSGGTGKTRLSLAVAAAALEHFEDGVFVVNLAPIADATLVPGLIGRALGLPESGNRYSLERLKEHLSSKQQLLLLDNFEQIVDGPQVVASLLGACPRLKVLVTSRSPLRLRGEKELLLTPMSLPPRGKLLGPEELSRYDSVSLFVARASDVKAGFSLNEENASIIAQICDRLDGLPLAIELAAARTKIFSPKELLERMTHRLPMLIGGAADLPSRQQTLRATVEWSVDLLSRSERILFERLSTFVGGFDINAAETICKIEGDELTDVPGGIQSLVDKNLLQHQQIAGGLSRLTFLETIREYARGRLDESSDASIIRRRHAEYYAALVQALAPPDRWGYRDEVVDQLEREHDNVRAALEWSLKESTFVGFRLIAALWRFWHRQGYSSEGRTWLARLLRSTKFGADAAQVKEARARALHAGGMLALNQDEFTAAGLMFREALLLATEIPDDHCIAEALHGSGMVALHTRELARAVRFFEQSLTLGERLERAPIIADALMYLGLLAHERAENDRARTLLQESVRVRREARDQPGLGPSLSALGYAALEQGDVATARACFEERLAIWRDRRERRNIALAICSLGELALVSGDTELARARFEEGLAIFRSKDEPGGFAIILACFAFLAVRENQPERAVRLAGAAAKTRERYGSMLAPSLRLRLERMIQMARNALSDPQRGKEWAVGQEMPLEQVINLALDKQRAR